MSDHRNRILGVILAGGASQRFGANKCAALLGGRPLLEWAAERAQPQVEVLLLNANDTAIGERFVAVERIADEAPREGPISGILAALAEAQRRTFTYVASFPCDTPFFPRELVSELMKVLRSSQADYAIASRGAIAHRIFALWPVSCRQQIQHAFANGTRSMRDIEHWLEPTWADFPGGDGPAGDPFFNINTRADLEAAECWLSESRSV